MGEDPVEPRLPGRVALDLGGQRPGRLPDLPAAAVEAVVEDGEQGAGQILLGGEQFVRVTDGGRFGGGGRPLLDAPDQRGQIGAVDGGLSKPPGER
ncbi:hypothetical protein Smic_14130 [Streptomyces microflavus]|uniref:Uncharacterized protein n=1 Tax=Streptomyces microflavus TaxID=1919 RepID=A0A7J0CME5_STRMI|nr:hypothetical protein Smic_14130 [Streptomyces microflavus]